MKKIIKIILGIIILLIIVLGLFLARKSITSDKQRSAWTDKLQLDYANALLSKGLNTNAAQAFEDYIAKSQADKKELASICYKLGNIYLDLKEYEKALANFYKSELLNPESEYKQDMNQKIVSALESLGLSQQAQYELEARTSIKPTTQRKENIAVRIGKREITNDEIEGIINRLPAQIKQGLNSNDARLRFVREYVATEVLYAKGKKLGLDKKANTRTAVEDFQKQLVLQDLLQDEIRKELKVTPEDVQLYYKANKDKYSSNEKAKVSYEEVKGRVENEYRAQKEQQIVQSMLDKALEQQEIEILYQPKIENDKAAK